MVKIFGISKCPEYDVEKRQIGVIELMDPSRMVIGVAFRPLNEIAHPLRSFYIGVLKDAEEICYQ